MKTEQLLKQFEGIVPGKYVGHVQKVSPGFVESLGPLCTVGDYCEIEIALNNNEMERDSVLAEVAAVEADRTVLIPLEESSSIGPDAKVVALRDRAKAPVGDAFAGRLVDALAQPMDDKGQILADHYFPVEGDVLKPMERAEPEKCLETGIRAIDGMLTIGKGQRLGIFAASGVGKTTLVTQLANQTNCDRCVICLVGERGREVETIWSELSLQENVSQFTCVAATSDMSSAIRARAVKQALSLAEYWRSQGEDVLLVIDSITRFAMALREIGLAAGAPPTLRAYTPNVFHALPRIVERCGGSKNGGSITAIISVLSETDDVDDPIVEVMKSLLDGHIILSRSLAERGHFPAIDVTRSVSRQSDKLMDETHTKLARKAIELISTYEESKVMIESGIYKKGNNKNIDNAIERKDALNGFLRQAGNNSSSLKETLTSLDAACGGT